MKRCYGVRQSTREWRCVDCGARWGHDDTAPVCSRVNTRMMALRRKRTVPERLTEVCEHLNVARAPEVLIREIEECIVALRTGSP